LLGFLDRLFSVGSLTHNLPARLLFEQVSKASAHDIVIVCH
jgi:hypothetical protein